MKKLIIAGANGFLAGYLTRYFTDKGWSVAGLARHEQGLEKQCRYVNWNGKTLGDWVTELDGCDVLINMTGRSINCRHTDENKRQILDSRVDTTRVLGQAVAACENPPELWLNASGASIYETRTDRPNTEGDSSGEGFAAEVAKVWEEEFFGAKVPGKVRKIALRTTMVLANEAGTVFDYLQKLAKFGLGGKVATGKQMVSWIHIDDYCRAVDFLIDSDQVSGPVNMSAPDPVTNAEMMRRFRKLAGMPLGMPAAAWMARIGAYVLGTAPELILDSMWVVPTRLLENGFVFNHPEMKPEAWVG